MHDQSEKDILLSIIINTCTSCDLLTVVFKVDAENVQRELEMLSQSGASNDHKSNSLVSARESNSDLHSGHSQSNGIHSSANTGSKGIVNGLPGKLFK